jgi:hypothetical protein
MLPTKIYEYIEEDIMPTKLNKDAVDLATLKLINNSKNQQL